MTDKNDELLWINISELPYFRAYLRAVEGSLVRKYDVLFPALDLGCGDGHFGARTFPGASLIGADPSFTSLLAAKKYGKYLALISCDGHNMPFEDHSFRTIICNSVLEHIESVDGVISEAKRILKRKGKVIATMPNQNFTRNLFFSRFFERMKLSIFADLYRKSFNFISRHKRTEDKEEWCARFKKIDFKIEESFNYFSSNSLRILELGHIFGIPSWMTKKLLGRWVLLPTKSNPILKIVFNRIKKEFDQEQRMDDGAYTLIIARK